MARTGQHLARLLAERGIETAFGLPAQHALEIWRGLPGAGLRMVTARSAAGAGHMADGYARVARRPAACLLGAGPGVAGAASALGQAFGDSVPMLLVTAGPHRGRDGPGALHAMADPLGMLRGLARWSRAVEAPDELPEALDAACALFAAARPGPVHLHIPADVLGAEAGVMDAPPMALPQPPAPLAAEVAEAVMRLSIARAPLLLLGGGALGIGAARAAALAERLGGPVLTTSNGRGLLPQDHKLHLGGRFPSEPVRALLSAADAVLAIGTEFAAAEWTPGGAPPPPLLPDALIRVDRDPAQLEAPAAGLGIACDAVAFVDALLESLPPRDRPPADLGPLRARSGNAMPSRLARHQPLLEALWEHLPEAIIVADPCEPAYAGIAAAAPPAPGRWWCSASGFGSMGYAVPAAIGAKIADHRRPVVALVGDGGMLATAGELAAAVEHGAHVLVLVWNNSGFNEVREQMRAAQIRPTCVDLSPIDFQSLSRAFGASYARISGLDYLRDALRSAVTRPTPCLLELREEFWFG